MRELDYTSLAVLIGPEQEIFNRETGTTVSRDGYVSPAYTVTAGDAMVMSATC